MKKRIDQIHYVPGFISEEMAAKVYNYAKANVDLFEEFGNGEKEFRVHTYHQIQEKDVEVLNLIQSYAKKVYDFVLEKYKIIIELDGEQHFIQVRKWNNNVDEAFSRDMYKMDCARNNGYKVIRITQKDVYNDNNDWYDKLITCIEKLYINNNQTYFISSKEDIYDKYLFYIFNKYYYQE